MTIIELTDEEVLILIRALNVYQSSNRLSDTDLVTTINAKSTLITAQNQQKISEAYDKEVLDFLVKGWADIQQEEIERM